VGDYDYRTCNHAHRLPTLFTVDNLIEDCAPMGIVKNQLRSLEADFVLSEVTPILVLIPFVAHYP